MKTRKKKKKKLDEEETLNEALRSLGFSTIRSLYDHKRIIVDEKSGKPFGAFDSDEAWKFVQEWRNS